MHRELIKWTQIHHITIQRRNKYPKSLCFNLLNLCVTVLVPLACTSHVYVCFTTVCASHMCVCRVCASRACLSFVSTMCVCLSCVSHVCASHVCICHVLCTSHMCLVCTRTHPFEQSHPHMHTLLHPRVFPVYYLRSYVGIFLLRLAHSH